MRKYTFTWEKRVERLIYDQDLGYNCIIRKNYQFTIFESEGDQIVVADVAIVKCQVDAEGNTSFKFDSTDQFLEINFA